MWSPSGPAPDTRAPRAVSVGTKVTRSAALIGALSLAFAQVPVAGASGANTWTKRTMTPRDGFAVGVVNGVLHAVGGSRTSNSKPYYSSYFTTAEAFDPATNAWTPEGPMPTARWGLAVGVVNGVLYAVGGSPGATVEAYDLFDLFILVANPNATEARFDVRFLLPDGTVLTRPYAVPANHRADCGGVGDVLEFVVAAGRGDDRQHSGNISLH